MEYRVELDPDDEDQMLDRLVRTDIDGTETVVYSDDRLAYCPEDAYLSRALDVFVRELRHNADHINNLLAEIQELEYQIDALQEHNDQLAYSRGD